MLPLHRRDDDSGWASADWQLRRGRIVLLEGDSPAGLRLPLNSISWHPPRAVLTKPTRSPSAAGCRRRPNRTTRGRGVEDAEAVPTTAMVAEIRDGLALHLSCRPPKQLEHFVDLITRVEAAAAKVDCPVVDRGLRAAARSADRVDERHPRPRRHRGQRRADGQLRRAEAAAGNPLRAGPAGPAVAPSRSTSTAPTAAPAAATTSRWAASRPPIRRCCAAPTCWCRC